MSPTSRIGFAQIPHALLLDRRLTRVDRDVAHALLLKAKRDPEIEVSNKRLASLARCSVRAAQAALKRLAEVGWIGLVRGVAGRLQRRIALYFRPEHRPENRPLHVCTESPTSEPCTYARGAAPDPIPPMYPPVIPENQEEILVVEDAPEPPPPPPPPAVAEPAPPPPGIVEVAPVEEIQSPPKATPEQIAKLVEEAAKVFPTQPRRWVLALAKTWTLSWVKAAIGRAASKRAEGAEVRTGYVIRTLQSFAAEGGPPPELTAPERGQDEVMRLFMEAFERA